MKIAQSLLDQIIAHARAETPNECCGLIGVRDGRADKVYPCKNVARVPQFSFKIGIDMQDAFEDMDERGAEFGGLYHSHPRTAAYPSPTDQNESQGTPPDVEWLIVGLDTEPPGVRCFRVTPREVEELVVEVE
jgi:proteasome lid subunit RPN8/RPN11